MLLLHWVAYEVDYIYRRRGHEGGEISHRGRYFASGVMSVTLLACDRLQRRRSLFGVRRRNLPRLIA
jgi:hypothetical protein